ncbi:unnamed protein product [Paramecium sonneborni]|uniref:Uncharacterized protein n=1 Tax=Paramecium sonneborni TaxID=65129 RepID=A0A8S1RRR2_9CILI|nr:unnamed protein product [Paramecium sonneborni]
MFKSDQIQIDQSPFRQLWFLLSFYQGQCQIFALLKIPLYQIQECNTNLIQLQIMKQYKVIFSLNHFQINKQLHSILIIQILLYQYSLTILKMHQLFQVLLQVQFINQILNSVLLNQLFYQQNFLLVVQSLLQQIHKQQLCQIILVSFKQIHSKQCIDLIKLNRYQLLNYIIQWDNNGFSQFTVQFPEILVIGQHKLPQFSFNEFTMQNLLRVDFKSSYDEFSGYTFCGAQNDNLIV